jgi:hypothetical protein
VAGVVAVWVLLALTAGSGDEEPADSARPTTTEPERATTTTRRRARPAPTTTIQVVPGAPLLGEPTGLIVLTMSDRGRILHLDTGVVELMPRATAVIGSTARGLLVAGPDLELWPPPYDGSGAVTVTVGTVDQAWVVADGTQVWTIDGGGSAGVRARLLNLSGSVLLDHPLPVEAWAVGAVDQGLVLSAPGGTFLLDGGGSARRLSTGSALAAGGGRVYVANCDDALRCEHQALDERGRLVRRWNPGGNAFVGPAAPSPDGRLAYTSNDADGTSSVAVDGVALMELGFGGGQSMAWSPDGRWLVVSSTDRLHVLDTRGAEEHQILDLEPGAPPPWQLLVVADS